MKKFNVSVTVIVKEIEVTEAEALEYAKEDEVSLEEAYERVAFSKAYNLVSDGEWDELDTHDVEEV